MASGRLGAAELDADTYTTVYTVPANTVATLNIAIVNRGVFDARVQVALTTQTTTPLNADFVEFDTPIPSLGVLERTALVAGPGEKVMIRASRAEVTVRVHGFEQENN